MRRQLYYWYLWCSVPDLVSATRHRSAYLACKVINTIVNCIAPYLEHFIKKCIDDGVFPDLMKYSKVIFFLSYLIVV